MPRKMKGQNCNRQILQEIRFLLVELGLRKRQFPIIHPGSTIDVQMMLMGTEGTEWFPANSLEIKTTYDSTKDVEFYHRPHCCPVRMEMQPGIFAVFFPDDAHLTQLVVGEKPQLVKKAVVKVNKIMQ